MTKAPRPRARRGEGDQLRAEILDAADRLLIETASEEAVSIRAVADAVGVTPPSIYRHFPDKDRLLLEVCRGTFDRFHQTLSAADRGGDPVDRLLEIGRAYLRFAVEHPEHYRIMFMSRFELSAQEYAEELLASGGSFALLFEVTQAIVDSGALRPQVAERGPLHVGIVFWTAVHGLASLLVAKPGLPWPDTHQLGEDVMISTIRGLAVDPSVARP